MSQARVSAFLITAVVLIGLGFSIAWFWQANSYGAQLASQASANAADLQMISNAAAQQARVALEKQQETQKALASSDALRTKEKADALAENDRLRRDLAGGKRMRVAGNCSAGNGDVHTTPSAAGLGDAGTVELSAGAGQNVLDIRAGIIADQAALKALQDYARACQAFYQTPIK